MDEMVDLTKSLREQRAKYVEFRAQMERLQSLYKDRQPLEGHLAEQIRIIDMAIANVDVALKGA